MAGEGEEALPARFAPPEEGGRPDVLIVAGEHSGDEHASALVSELKERMPGVKVCAVGGEALAREGAQLLFDLTRYSVVGLVEVLRNYGFFRGLMARVLSWISEYRPRAVCFVDYPGFNLRAAKRLYEGGVAAKAGGDVKLLYYISPQIWAWKQKRRFRMARYLDSLAVIFPFETAVYGDTDLPVQFVGHPFVTSGRPLPVRYERDAPLLLFPGSRRQAVGRIFPLMLAGLEAFGKRLPRERACVLYPSTGIRDVLRGELAKRPELAEQVALRPVAEGAAGKAVLTSSGTMSLACALAGLPGAIIYRAHPLTYAVGRLVVKVDYLGIANILLERPGYPEFIQGRARPGELAAELGKCVTDRERIARAQADARTLRELLGEPGSASAGQWLMRELGG